MKLFKLSLLTTIALVFTGCALDDALNSVTNTIDSITTTNKTNNMSNKYNLEVKSLTTVAQVQNFCKNSPDDMSYIITALPDLKMGDFPGSIAEQILVANSKNDIIIEAGDGTAYINYRREAFSPSNYDPRNPKQKIKLIKPIMVYKSTGQARMTCRLEYSRPR